MGAMRLSAAVKVNIAFAIVEECLRRDTRARGG
jgi:hypothetical protein